MQDIQYDFLGGSSRSMTQLSLYPEREINTRKFELANGIRGVLKLPIKLQKNILHRKQFVIHVNKKEQEIANLPKSSLIHRLLSLRKILRRVGPSLEHTSEAFALIRELSLRSLGRRHYDSQILAAWVMLNGMVADMQTGEGKTLAISLAAATAALAGTPTHVLTANDYLAERDATTLLPLFQMLGLSVGIVTGSTAPDERRTAYACDITYCTVKELAVDYLRDRMVFDSDTSESIRRLDRLYGSHSRSALLLLRGLHFAILDECDSILIDDANSPIVLAGPIQNACSDSLNRDAVKLARNLDEGHHFTLVKHEKRVVLTQSGRDIIQTQIKHVNVYESRADDIETMIIIALSALHFFHKDQHYLVRDNCVQIIDENTGRIRSNTSWERGLQQMIEAKEGCKITLAQKVLSRISLQRLFMRYLQFAGTSGTVLDAKRELRQVYGLGVIQIPTHRSVKRKHLQEMHYATEDQKLEAIVASVVRVHKTQRPILLAARTVESAAKLSFRIKREGLKHQLLSGKQDKNEAKIIARAGSLGCITIATNMAGRGTDITTSSEVSRLGGLHVIVTERHEAVRIDHQLFDRCARQGDPGSCQLFISVQDKLLELYAPVSLLRLANSRLSNQFNYNNRLNTLISRYAQWRSERHQIQNRRNLLRSEENMQKIMGFAGPAE